jgi:phosphatidylglycerophosphatase A
VTGVQTCALPIFVLGIPACAAAEAAYGPDPRQAVVDEVAGQVVTLLFAPLNGLTLALGFLLFRCFDIAKAPPVSWAERLPGGWGVMADDLLAGLYAGACLWLAWEVLTLRPWPWPALS